MGCLKKKYVLYQVVYSVNIALFAIQIIPSSMITVCVAGCVPGSVRDVPEHVHMKVSPSPKYHANGLGCLFLGGKCYLYCYR